MKKIGEKEYIICERSYEYDEILKEENLTGVWLLFEEETLIPNYNILYLPINFLK